MASTTDDTTSHRDTGVLAVGEALPVRTISLADIKDILLKGLDDFRAMPTHILFLGIIYAVLGFLLVRLTFHYGLIQFTFPLVAGFALLGPLAATGLYELSRRRERGLDTTWWRMFGVVTSPSIGAIATLGLILIATFVLWLGAAFAIYNMTFTASPADATAFLHDLLTTKQGWALIIVGNGVGAVFAVFAFAISVVAFPLLTDRKVSLAAAVATSIKAVLANPKSMAVWGLIVTGALVIGCIPIFIGLAVVLPVLGHATWHLYRKVVES